MLHVGLTGGLASGKSVVGRELERLGCRVIRMDDLGHQVLAPDGEAYAPVVQAFGPSILNPDRTVNRRALGKLVFGDERQLERLNALVHPAILARAEALADDYAREHPDGIAVTEAAIMVETGSYKKYDRLIVAACRPEQQVERALARPNALSRAEVLDRMSRQMPIEEKVKYADFVIDTSGSEESTILQTRATFDQLRSMKR
jgi:dephospho-CoA kinase